MIKTAQYLLSIVRSWDLPEDKASVLENHDCRVDEPSDCEDDAVYPEDNFIKD